MACWKGKSRLNAWKNQLVDQRTNSVQEGFRLEGIECPPQALEQRIRAVMDTKGLAATKYISPKARGWDHWGERQGISSWLDCPASFDHSQRVLVHSEKHFLCVDLLCPPNFWN